MRGMVVGWRQPTTPLALAGILLHLFHLALQRSLLEALLPLFQFEISDEMARGRAVDIFVDAKVANPDVLGLGRVVLVLESGVAPARSSLFSQLPVDVLGLLLRRCRLRVAAFGRSRVLVVAVMRRRRTLGTIASLHSLGRLTSSVS